MNWSVPSSPPLTTAALTRIATISPSIAQNSVVLKAAFVSVARRRARRSTGTWSRCAAGARETSDAAIRGELLVGARVNASLCATGQFGRIGVETARRLLVVPRLDPGTHNGGRKPYGVSA